MSGDADNSEAILSAARHLCRMASELPALIGREVDMRCTLAAIEATMRAAGIDQAGTRGRVQAEHQAAAADAHWCWVGVRSMAVRLVVLVHRAQQGAAEPDEHTVRLGMRQRASRRRSRLPSSK